LTDILVFFEFALVSCDCTSLLFTLKLVSLLRVKCTQCLRLKFVRNVCLYHATQQLPVSWSSLYDIRAADCARQGSCWCGWRRACWSTRVLHRDVSD